MVLGLILIVLVRHKGFVKMVINASEDMNCSHYNINGMMIFIKGVYIVVMAEGSG